MGSSLWAIVIGLGMLVLLLVYLCDNGMLRIALGLLYFFFVAPLLRPVGRDSTSES